MNKTNNTYNVGQVVFILSSKTQKIIPALVVEEIIVKKITGNETSWKFSVGPKSKEQILDSNAIEGDIYSSLSEVKLVLVDKLNNFVNSLVDETIQRTEAWYAKQISLDSHISQDSKISTDDIISSIEQIKAVSTPIQQTKEPSGDYMEMPDGTKVKVNIIQSDI